MITVCYYCLSLLSHKTCFEKCGPTLFYADTLLLYILYYDYYYYILFQHCLVDRVFRSNNNYALMHTRTKQGMKGTHHNWGLLNQRGCRPQTLRSVLDLNHSSATLVMPNQCPGWCKEVWSTVSNTVERSRSIRAVTLLLSIADIIVYQQNKNLLP